MPPTKLYSLNYRGLQSVDIYTCMDWYKDEQLPRNFAHHLMSLRWLDEIKDFESKKIIIMDFVRYHSESEKISKFYLGRAADHSASIRVKVLSAALESESYLFSEKDYEIVKGEIYKIIDSCIAGNTYKEAHNHGLMVDLALIDMSEKGFIGSRREKILEAIPDRILNQLKSIFSDDGACKEHSISYQEYDLSILHDLKKTLFDKQSSSRVITDLFIKVDEIYRVVKEESKKLLGYSLVRGRYFPLGDSPGNPKREILEKVFGDSDPDVALSPYSHRTGYYFSQSAGLFLYRGINYSIGFTAAWHSSVHKQNDDLSIVLYDKNGSPIIVDGGYSGVIKTIDQRSENFHSTFMPVNASWKKRKKGLQDFSILNIDNRDDQSIKVEGIHSRVSDYLLSRRLLVTDTSVLIEDGSNSECLLRHRFMFPKERVLVTKVDDYSYLVSGFLLEFTGSESFNTSESFCILEDSLVPTFVLDVYSRGGLKISVSTL